ncbi:MAG TPA: isochorismatase family protein [Candidatus Limnocylindrales bacterium]
MAPPQPTPAPMPLVFGPASALLLVDVQNDFADAAGSLHVAGGEDLPPLLNALIGDARRSGALVAYTQDWHPEHTPHFAADGGAWPVHCVKGTWGAALHPALVVAGPIVRKGSNGEDGYSGFSMRDPGTGVTVPTGLEELLHRHAVRQLVIAGLATDYCVLATGLDAVALGFETAIVVDGVRAVDLAAGDGERALERLVSAGVTLVEATGA